MIIHMDSPFRTDGNNDGALSLEELEARIVNKTRAHLEEGVIEAKTHIKIVDTNGDGKVRIRSIHRYCCASAV